MNAVDVLGAILSSEVIVIQGSGPLALLATDVTRVAGARRVITIGVPDARSAGTETLPSNGLLIRSATIAFGRSPGAAAPTS